MCNENDACILFGRKDMTWSTIDALRARAEDLIPSIVSESLTKVVLRRYDSPPPPLNP
jgi:hypothetical protein